MSNKETISQCALELFYKKGYEAVGVQEIVDAAGITKPTLYHYFKSKYGLLESIVSDKCNILCETIEKASEVKQDLPGTLQKVATEYFKYASENIQFISMMISMQYSARESEPHKAIVPYTTRLFEMMVSIFTNAEQTLGNMHGRQRQFASGFLGVLNSYLIIEYETYSQEGCLEIGDRDVYLLVHQFMHGIYS